MVAGLTQRLASIGQLILGQAVLGLGDVALGLGHRLLVTRTPRTCSAGRDGRAARGRPVGRPSRTIRSAVERGRVPVAAARRAWDRWRRRTVVDPSGRRPDRWPAAAGRWSGALWAGGDLLVGAGHGGGVLGLLGRGLAAPLGQGQVVLGGGQVVLGGRQRGLRRRSGRAWPAPGRRVTCWPRATSTAVTVPLVANSSSRSGQGRRCRWPRPYDDTDPGRSRSARWRGPTPCGRRCWPRAGPEGGHARRPARR